MRLAILVTFLSAIAGATGSAEAAKLLVANNGVDGATCGDKSNPCRSISQAIQNAVANDTIIVGPGRYGDLDGNGSFGEPGDEHAEVGTGCSCMIRIDKPLTIESSDGAAATVLDANRVGIDVVGIGAGAAGVVFGKKKKGFTLTGSDDGSGLFVAGSTAGVKITANLATQNRFAGFAIFGNGHVITGNVASANGDNGFDVHGGNHVMTGNVARNNGDNGFFARGSGHRLSENAATANGLHGFDVGDSGHSLTANVASTNDEEGFEVDGSGHSFGGNAAHGNSGAGFALLGSSYTLTGNSIVGNEGSGVFVGALASNIQITKSNIFGNSRPENSAFGVFNASGQIQAINNFWGAASGPGPDPADDILDDAVGSQTVFAPFATKAFKIKTVVVTP